MMRISRLSRLILSATLVFIGAAAGSAHAAPAPQKPLSYNRDVRPILSDNCFACHGPDRNKRKAKLRLDDRDVAIEKKAIVPGDVEKSEVVARIFSTDPDKQMPPPDSNKKLTEAQRQTLKRWIASGAVYEPFWAYVIPHRPVVPAVADRQWARNPIDAFILEQLEARHIAPSPQADRRTLLRRLSLDLIGLPPTPEEMQAFLNDHRPDAYERQVDRLLASPHYGERMAVPWLDAVRFADTVGFHGDQNQDVFPYRDYVINSFNNDKPFDRFTTEQLAGDLLPHPTTEQLVASGFNRLNMITREGGAQPKEYLAKYMADRVRTIGSCFLGATLGCCECHDHKYDPFTARDFYSMGAYFADIKQWGVYMDYAYTPNPDLRGFTNDHPFPPEIVVDSPYLQQRQRRLENQLDQVVAAAGQQMLKDATARKRFEEWKSATADYLQKHPDGWTTVKPLLPVASASETDAKATEEAGPDGAVIFTGAGKPAKAMATDRVEFVLEPGTSIAAIRLELLPTDQHHGQIVRVPLTKSSTSGIVQMSAAIKPADGNSRATKRLKVYFADADHKDARYSNGYPILGVQGGWKLAFAHAKERQTAVYLLDAPVTASAGDRLVLTFARDVIGCARVSVSPIAPFKAIEPTLADACSHALSVEQASASDEKGGLLLERTYFLSTAADVGVLARMRHLHEAIIDCRDGQSPEVVTVSVTPTVTRVLPRGNWQDQSGPIVDPMPPHFLPQPKIEGRRQTRLDLARWITSADNPLTSRVFVNRLWKQLFGAGICNSVEDFGAQGEWPSHPELLDWLAVEFRESGWDVKHMVRLMVTSSTYRQQCGLRPEVREIDPGNRLLSCQSPRRLEAEFVRDNALAAAGLICLDIGGPSVFPYQPAGYYANIQFPDRDYIPDLDERQWRRGVYMHWQRTFLHPMLANFDAPSREDSVCTRNVSNTPQQALTLLNDPEFVEAARVLAQHVIAAHAGQGKASDAARLDMVFERVLCRPPEERESKSLTDFLAGQRAYYGANVEDAKKLTHIGIAPVADVDPAELAAWTSVCRVVLNLHETITRY